MKRWAMVGLLGMLACSNASSSAPEAGTLALTLSTPAHTDGAVVLVVSGGPILSVSPAADYQIASNADGEGTHLMVTGSLTSGVIATLQIPDRTRAAAYVATISQVADRSSFALLDPAPYRVTVAAQ